MDLRSFVFGIMVGIAILIGVFATVSYSVGLKWQPVKIGALSTSNHAKASDTQ